MYNAPGIVWVRYPKIDHVSSNCTSSPRHLCTCMYLYTMCDKLQLQLKLHTCNRCWHEMEMYYSTIQECAFLCEMFMYSYFQFHLATAQYWGELARALADSLIIPMDVTEYPLQVGSYLSLVLERYGHTIASEGFTENISMLCILWKNIQSKEEMTLEMYILNVINVFLQ